MNSSMKSQVYGSIKELLKLFKKRSKPIIKHALADACINFKLMNLINDEKLSEIYYSFKNILENFNSFSFSEIEDILTEMKYNLKYSDDPYMIYWWFPARFWQKEDISFDKDKINSLKPAACQSCDSKSIEYWDESEKEIIFRCQSCGRFFLIPLEETIIMPCAIF